MQSTGPVESLAASASPHQWSGCFPARMLRAVSLVRPWMAPNRPPTSMKRHKARFHLYIHTSTLQVVTSKAMRAGSSNMAEASSVEVLLLESAGLIGTPCLLSLFLHTSFKRGAWACWRFIQHIA